MQKAIYLILTSALVLALQPSLQATIIFTDDFDYTSGSANDVQQSQDYRLDDSKPTGVWHQQDPDNNSNDSDSPYNEEQSGTPPEASTAFADLDLTGDTDNEFRIGFGYDEIETVYNTGILIDLSQDYTFSGSWEIQNANFDDLGFIAGIAEFNSTTGNLVQYLATDTFGVLTGAGTAGVTGSFTVTATAADLLTAGATNSNYIGVYLHHNDGGALYNESTNSSVRADVYIVDDVQLVAIPEPASILFLILSGFGFWLFRRRK